MQKDAGMVSWNLVYTNQAQKDARKLSSAGLRGKAGELLAIIKINPYPNPPPYERLIGDLAGAISRRINIHNRLIYQVYEKARTIKVIRMFAHYE